MGGHLRERDMGREIEREYSVVSIVTDDRGDTACCTYTVPRAV